MAELSFDKNPRGLGAAVTDHLTAYFSAHTDHLPMSGLYDRVMREVEAPLLSLALSACKGNQIKAAALLGINRNTLRKKLSDLGIEASRR
jgi:two-component system, NtrC family, nitrogen regulation response regulator GlnG